MGLIFVDNVFSFPCGFSDPDVRLKGDHRYANQGTIHSYTAHEGGKAMTNSVKKIEETT